MEKSGSLAGEDCAGWDELVGVISTGKTYQNQMAVLAETTGPLQQPSRVCRSAASSRSGSKPARREPTRSVPPGETSARSGRRQAQFRQTLSQAAPRGRGRHTPRGR